MHFHIFYLEPTIPLKQFLPGFRFILGLSLNKVNISLFADFLRAFSNCLEPGGIRSHFVHPWSSVGPEEDAEGF